MTTGPENDDDSAAAATARSSTTTRTRARTMATTTAGKTKTTSLTVNRAFAERFEHNERRKEMHRLQAKLAREYATTALEADAEASDSASASSETESDEEETLERAFDGAFAEALTKIRRRDPSLYEAETKLFDDETTEEEEDEKEEGKTKQTTTKKKKKATLREVTARQLLEGGATALEDAEAEAEAMKARDDAPSYVEEQAALKRAFKDAAFGAGGGGSGEESESDDSDDDDDDDGGLVVKSRAEDASAATEKLSEFFGDEEKLSAEDKFLREYVLEKQWMKDDAKSVAARMKTLGGNDESDSDDDDEASDGDAASSDSELLERAEAFEHNYNFRFEEPGADKLVSHSRHIEGLVRREDTKRRDKRKQVRERKESERAKLLAEIRRLKNLKREEIENKMRQISAVGGLSSKTSASSLKVTNLTEEFDPEAHDRAMREMYGEEYYEDEDDGALGAKPEFGDLDEEVKEMLAAEGADEEEVDEEAEVGDDDNDDDDDDDDDGNDENDGDDGDERDDVEENKFSKRAAKKWRKQLEAKMDEYYKLDAEDFIGDVPTRFAYTEVAPKMYGLTTRDILQMDDKSLNQIVGLKKLAPYREDADDAAVSANQRARARRMAKEFYAKSADKKKAKGSRTKGTKKKRDDDDGDDDEDDDEDEAAEARAKSYADAAFGKKKSKSSSSKRAKKSNDDDEKPLEPQRSAVGKNAKKNAKKRAKRKAAAAEATL